MAVAGFWDLLRRKVLVVVDEQGIVYKPMFRKSLYLPWGAISGVVPEFPRGGSDGSGEDFIGVVVVLPDRSLIRIVTVDDPMRLYQACQKFLTRQ